MRNVHSICKVSMLVVGRDVSRQINEDGIVEFGIQQARDRFG